MTARFAIGIGLSLDGQNALKKRIGDAEHEILLDSPGLVIAATSQMRTIEIGGFGFVIGALFSCKDNQLVTTFDTETAIRIGRDCGQSLIECYWGDYVAVIRSAATVAVVRSPFGTLPCLYRPWAGGVVVASEIDSLEHATKVPNSVAFDQVARQLVVGDLRSSRTCLTDVHEVRGGQVAFFAGTSRSHHEIWTPWSIARAIPGCERTVSAAAHLREIAIGCVSAKTRAFKKPLVLLSGGLDSSIVTACLADGRRDMTCLNLVAPASAGDERLYARAVAGHLGHDLLERPMPERSLELGTLAGVRLPRPVARSFEQRIYREAQAVAKEQGCDGIVDGGGGDNVFCSLQSASPAADCILDSDGRRRFWHTCNAIADMTNASIGRVVWKALRRATTRSRPYRWAINDRMLSAEAKATAAEAVGHPWLSMDPSRLPGRAAQIALLVAAQSFVEDGPHGAKTHVVSPLVSQPLIEHCLSIPSWQWFDRGCNRAVARHAFAPLLPASAVWRRGKGVPDSFIVRLFETNRSYIREHLLGGMLAHEGLIDTAPVCAALDDPAPFGGAEFGRLVRLMDAETWARNITGGIRG